MSFLNQTPLLMTDGSIANYCHDQSYAQYVHSSAGIPGVTSALEALLIHIEKCKGLRSQKLVEYYDY